MITGILEPLAIMPNPSQDAAIVKGLNGIALTITSLNGQQMLTKSIEGISSVNLDLTSLSSGIYFLNVVGNEGMETIRFVKN